MALFEHFYVQQVSLLGFLDGAYFRAGLIFERAYFRENTVFDINYAIEIFKV